MRISDWSSDVCSSDLIARGGRTVVAVLHDLSLVAQFADAILWLGGGRLLAHGPASRDAFARHVPALFGRDPAFAEDGSNALYFRRLGRDCARGQRAGLGSGP